MAKIDDDLLEEIEVLREELESAENDIKDAVNEYNLIAEKYNEAVEKITDALGDKAHLAPSGAELINDFSADVPDPLTQDDFKEDDEEEEA